MDVKENYLYGNTNKLKRLMIWDQDNNGLVYNGPMAKSVSGNVKKGKDDKINCNTEVLERSVENKERKRKREREREREIS